MQQEKNASAPVGGRHTLEFRGISKTYPGVKALQDVSFTVESGKVLVGALADGHTDNDIALLSDL